MKFYTNISTHKGRLLVTGYENGVRFKRKVKYKPYLFTPTTSDTPYKTVNGLPVGRVDFDSMSEAKEFIKEYKDVDGFDIFGLEKFQYVYIYDEFRKNGKFEYDASLINEGYIDIETSMLGDRGFPDVRLANIEVTLITLAKNDEYHVYGCQPFSIEMVRNHPDKDLNLEDVNFTYHECFSEKDLLRKFLDKWIEFELDTISGWNVDKFDIPYLVNRITKILGEDYARQLSPWEILEENNIKVMGKEHQTFNIVGITTLDYIDLYKKFAFTQQESYKLNHIAQEELGEKKLTYDGTLADLEAKDWVRYCAYNTHDVRLVARLEEKRKLIKLVFALAYDCGINYQDTFATVNPWDITIHNYLLDRNIVVPAMKHQRGGEITGGFVKEPQKGMHGWVVSFDLTSLYPHLIMQYNISPETFVGRYQGDFTIDDILDGYFNNDARREEFVKNNYSIAANGTMYRNDILGFLPEIMEEIFNARKEDKKSMLACEQEIELIKQEIKRRGLIV